MAHTRVVIASSELRERLALRKSLLKLGYEVMREVADGGSLVHLARTLRPDVVLLDLHLRGLDGLRAAKAIAAERLAPVVLFGAFADSAVARHAAAAGVAACLSKPVGGRKLLPAIELALAAFRATGELRREAAALREEADIERLLHRAKRVVMAELGIGPLEAVQRVQGLALSSNKSLQDTAKAILLAAQTAR